MSHARPLILVGIALGIGGFTYASLHWLVTRGASIPVDGISFAVAAVIGCLLSAWLALQVHRLKEGQPTWMTAIGAARVAALALSLSHLGAIFLGYFGGQLVFLVINLANEALAAGLWHKVLGVLGALAVLATGIVIERVCTIDPNDPPPKPPQGTASAPA